MNGITGTLLIEKHILISRLVSAAGLIVLLLAGCVHEEPGLPEQNLIGLLSESRSSLSTFSYDIGSTMLIPFLTGLGKYRYSSNIVSANSNVVVTLPLVPMRPAAFIIQSRPQEEGGQETLLRIILNEEEAGTMTVGGDIVRKRFKIKPGIWDREINVIRIEMPRSGSPVFIDNLWLLVDASTPSDKVEEGNRFVGFVAFAGGDTWEEAVLLPEKASISVPVKLPWDNAFFEAEVISDENKDVLMEMQCITARALRPENPLHSSVAFRQPNAWLPLRWDISERKGRHALLKISNTGESAVLLRNILVRSEPSEPID
jgi:hypothetical protein